MALPATIDPSTPSATDALGLGDDKIRALKQFIIDVFGIPSDPTAIAQAAMLLDANGLAIAKFANLGADPATAGHLQRNGNALKFRDATAVRTLINDVTDAVIAATVTKLQESGGPATLTMAAVPDQSFLVRTGTTVIGVDYSQSSNAYGARTISSSAPSGGNDGDIWYQY